LKQLTSTESSTLNFQSSWSSDGSKIVFTRITDFSIEYNPESKFFIYVMDADGCNEKMLHEGGSDAKFSPNGSKIAFRVSGGELYIMNSDGSEVKRVISKKIGGDPYSWSWSSNSKQLAYLTEVEIDQYRTWTTLFKINIDSTKNQKLTKRYVYHVAWSPTEQKIAFTANASRGYPQIFIINSDGTEEKQLTDYPSGIFEFAWSLDGSKIAFVICYPDTIEHLCPQGLGVMDKDGSNQKLLISSNDSNNGIPDNPVWSSDGIQIAYRFHDNNEGKSQIYIIDSFGDNKKKITNIEEGVMSPAWQP